MSVLVDIQAELKAPKSQRNSFGKYNYRSAEDILEAVKPLLKKHGAKLTLSDKPILIGDWHYIEATATFKSDEETESVTAYARESLTKKGMDESQITGTASSYARKYALNGLFLIDDTKDADTDEYQEQTAPKKNSQAKTSPQRITSEQANFYKKEIIAIATNKGSNSGEVTRWFLEKLGVADYKQINIEQIQMADGLISRLKGDKQ